MSEKHGKSTIDEFLRKKHSSLVNLSLTELLMLMVFVAMAFTVFASAEGKQELSVAQFELGNLRSEVSTLRERYRQLDETNRYYTRLLAILRAPNSTLPVELGNALGGTVDLIQNGAPLPDIQARLDSFTQMVFGLRGLPRCQVYRALVFDIQLKQDNTLSVRAFDGALQERKLKNVPGFNALINRDEIGKEELFLELQRIYQWSNLPQNRCRFSVNLTMSSSDIKKYFEIKEILETFFYTKETLDLGIARFGLDR